MYQMQNLKNELPRTWQNPYLSVVIIDETTRDQVRPTWKVHDSRLVGRTLAGTRGTSIALCNRFLNSGSIVSDSVADRTVRLDISEDGIIVWIWVEASNALVLDIF